MNRSFRAPERGMQGGGAAPGAKQRQQNGDSLRTSMMKEKEEELGMFLEMRKREKEMNNLLFQNTEEFDAPLGSRMGSSPIFSIPSAATPARKTGADDFLNSDNDKNDYDWLLTPPGTPLFSSLEMDSQRTVMSQLGTPKARPTVLKSRLADSQPEPTARSNSISRQPSIPPGSNASNAGIRRPSSSGGPTSRPGTPTGRPTLTTSKPAPVTSSRSMPTTSSSRAMSSRPTSTISSKPTPTTASRPSRSSTPTPRPTVPSTKPTLPTRSSTPTARSTPRSSTPTIRPSLPATKPVSRTATPTRRPNALSATTKTAMSAPGPTKSVPSTARNPAPPRASSPTVKPRTLKPSEMPGFSYDAPPNLRTSLSDRPISATRGRPGAPSIRSSSVDPAPNVRGVRRQSCSPSRGRALNGVNNIMGGSVPALNRAYAKANDHVTPGQYGTNMVDRVINMRKLVPPKQDDKHSPRSNLSGKSSSPDSMGIGRTLSKKSIDMAIRHMDLRRTIPGNLRPMMTNIPASSMYSVRSSGPARSSRTISMLDSPLATTSSNASSEMSVNNNGLCLDGNMDDEINSEKGVGPPASLRGR